MQFCSLRVLTFTAYVYAATECFSYRVTTAEYVVQFLTKAGIWCWCYTHTLIAMVVWPSHDGYSSANPSCSCILSARIKSIRGKAMQYNIHSACACAISVLLCLGWDLLPFSGECPLSQCGPYYWLQGVDWHHPVIMNKDDACWLYQMHARMQEY